MAKAKKNGETDAILTERLDVPLDAKEVAALGLELAEARLEHSVLKDEKHAKDIEVKIHNKQNGKHIRTRAMDEAEKAGVESRRQLSMFDAQKNGPAEK